MRNRRQIQPLGQIFTDESVGILVGRPLPRAMRVGEIDVDLQAPGQDFMTCHLLALIVSQRFPHAGRDMAEFVGEGFRGGLCRAVMQLGHDQIATLALDQRADRATVTGGLDQITFPVSRRDAGRHFGRTLINTEMQALQTDA